MVKPSVKDVLCLAQMYVARGWCRDTGRSDDEVCAGVAMGDAVSDAGVVGSPTAVAARTHLQRVIKARDVFGVFDWNDAPGRTQDEVLDAFSRAIELAEGA